MLQHYCKVNTIVTGHNRICLGQSHSLSYRTVNDGWSLANWVKYESMQNAKTILVTRKFIQEIK